MCFHKYFITIITTLQKNYLNNNVALTLEAHASFTRAPLHVLQQIALIFQAC